MIVDRSITKAKIAGWLLLISLLVMMEGCANLRDFLCKEKEQRVTPLVYLAKEKWPDWSDDSNQESLLSAASRSLEYLRRLPENNEFPYGQKTYRSSDMIETVNLFVELVKIYGLGSEAFKKAIEKNFEIYQAAGRENNRLVLFTGYYEPQLEGSRREGRDFPWPVYRKPDDLLVINLENFHKKYKAERVMARYEKGRVLPYYSREEIDGQGILRGKGYEILWLRNSIEAFFLQIQGSGQIRINDQEILRVGFAASNGHPYRSIGELVIREGLMQPEEVSLQGLKEFLSRNSEQRGRILNSNPSYVFFRIVERGPLGSLNEELTPGRSIATDSQIFPVAGLAYIVSRKPFFDIQGKVLGWRPFSRFVFNQDTGSAIKGPGRVDLFWGSGREAELAAGHMQEEGTLYFLTRRLSR